MYCEFGPIALEDKLRINSTFYWHTLTVKECPLTLLPFGNSAFLRRPQKFEKTTLLFWCYWVKAAVLSTDLWEIFFNFVAFSQCLNFTFVDKWKYTSLIVRSGSLMVGAPTPEPIGIWSEFDKILVEACNRFILTYHR